MSESPATPRPVLVFFFCVELISISGNSFCFLIVFYWFTLILFVVTYFFYVAMFHDFCFFVLSSFTASMLLLYYLSWIAAISECLFICSNHLLLWHNSFLYISSGLQCFLCHNSYCSWLNRLWHWRHLPFYFTYSLSLSFLMCKTLFIITVTHH